LSDNQTAQGGENDSRACPHVAQKLQLVDQILIRLGREQYRRAAAMLRLARDIHLM
jgi:hypothetical protein